MSNIGNKIQLNQFFTASSSAKINQIACVENNHIRFIRIRNNPIIFIRIMSMRLDLMAYTSIPLTPGCFNYISTLSFSPRITAQGLDTFSLAMVNSERMVNTWADHPKITVWPFSINNVRPLLKLINLPSMPVIKESISVLITKTPLKAMTNLLQGKASFSCLRPWYRYLITASVPS